MIKVVSLIRGFGKIFSRCERGKMYNLSGIKTRDQMAFELFISSLLSLYLIFHSLRIFVSLSDILRLLLVGVQRKRSFGNPYQEK